MTREKMEDLIEVTKLGEILNPREKKINPLVAVLAVIGGAAVVAGIAYAVYCFMAPDYLDDYDDEDYDDEDYDEGGGDEAAAGAEDGSGAEADEIPFN